MSISMPLLIGILLIRWFVLEILLKILNIIKTRPKKPERCGTGVIVVVRKVLKRQGLSIGK